jgi:hypothetical protein
MIHHLFSHFILKEFFFNLFLLDILIKLCLNLYNWCNLVLMDHYMKSKLNYMADMIQLDLNIMRAGISCTFEKKYIILKLIK